VLDLYTFAGGFAVQAALAGAREIVGIDRSEPALALAKEAAIRNGVAATLHLAARRAGADIALAHEAGGSHDDVEAAGPRAPDRSMSAKASRARQGAACGDAIADRRLLGQGERRLGAIDADDLARAGEGGLDGKTAGEGVEIEHAQVARQAAHETAIGALVEEPAGLLPGEEIGGERAPFSTSSTGPRRCP